MTKFRAPRLLAAILILAVLGAGAYAAFHRTSLDGEVYFLPVQGELRVIPGEDASLSLYLLSRGTPFFEKKDGWTCSLGDGAQALAWEAVRGDGYGDLRLYALQLELDTSEMQAQTIASVTFRSKDGQASTFSLGEIQIGPTKKTGEGRLLIVEHTGNGTLGAPHIFTLENPGPGTVTVTGADYGSLAPYLSELTVSVDGKPVDGGFPCTLEPGSRVTARAVFRNSVGRSIFVVSPSVSYTYGNGGQAGCYEVPAGTLGIPLGQELLEQIRRDVFGD
jgi:hypothetical protein